MKTTAKLVLTGAIALALGGIAGCAMTPEKSMTFFVTSVGSGKGADLGGLAGADAHCQKLAAAAGAGHRTWRAYLSQQAINGLPSVNARDRIGSGPWTNAKGVIVAYNVDELHGGNNITKQTNLTEKGAIVNGRAEKPNTHDALTGSDWYGRAYPAATDMTCGNYSKSGAEGAVQMGHTDREGLSDDPMARAWHSSHASRGGCSQEALRGTGGAGLFYCFAQK
jgi:hypothetical protein